MSWLCVLKLCSRAGGSPLHAAKPWSDQDATPAAAALAYRAILRDVRLGFDNLHLVPQSVYV